MTLVRIRDRCEAGGLIPSAPPLGWDNSEACPPLAPTVPHGFKPHLPTGVTGLVIHPGLAEFPPHLTPPYPS